MKSKNVESTFRYYKNYTVHFVPNNVLATFRMIVLTKSKFQNIATLSKRQIVQHNNLIALRLA